jgi:hypothetical protein
MAARAGYAQSGRPVYTEHVGAATSSVTGLVVASDLGFRFCVVGRENCARQRHGILTESGSLCMEARRTKMGSHFLEQSSQSVA